MKVKRNRLAVLVLFVQVLLLLHTGKAQDLAVETDTADDQETLIPDNAITIRFFGRSAMKFSTLDNDVAILGGGSVGILVNEAFIIGGDSYSLLNGQLMEKFRYGGLLLGYIHRPRSPVHVSVYSLIGGGTLRYVPDNYTFYNDGFFVFEPGLDLVINVTRAFRLGIGGTYRMIRGVDIAPISSVSGPTVSFSCTYRKF
jgi:hypothetical protein